MSMFTELLNSAFTTDVAVIVILIAIFVIYAVFRSTGLLISILLSLPIAGFLYNIFPYYTTVQSLLPKAFEPWVPFVILFLFIVPLMLVLHRSVGPVHGSRRPIHITITAVALTVVVISFSYHVIPIDSLYDFGATFDGFFESSQSLFWFVSVALLALLVV